MSHPNAYAVSRVVVVISNEPLGKELPGLLSKKAAPECKLTLLET